MYEVQCPACSSNFKYHIEDYIHLCPYCSAGFIIDYDDGGKDIIGEHYIVANTLDRERVTEIFMEWISHRYHRPDKLKSEFQVLSAYGLCLPYWVVSLEAHTVWSGQSRKANDYPGQQPDYASRFLGESGRFSRRYRWAIAARKNPKEHWGLERLHNPREPVMVDWDGFPFDDTMGVLDASQTPVYNLKQPFKFDLANGLKVEGIQIKESAAIARVKDQVNEYHRRICKTKVGTLHEHRTEIEVVGIHLVHIPLWFVRYAFTPKSMFRFFTPIRERRILIEGNTEKVLEAELPLNNTDKVMTNLVVTGTLAFVALATSVFFHPLFFLLFMVFGLVSVLSAWRIFGREKTDPELTPGKELDEPV